MFEGIAQFFVCKRIAFVKQIAEIAKYLLYRLDIARIAVYQQFVSASADTYIQKRFKVFDVLVLYAEKRVQTLGRKF